MKPLADWQELEKLDGSALKAAVFDIIQRASRHIQTEEKDEPELLEAVPRLAQLIDDRAELRGYRELHSAFARSLGLWNYIDRAHALDGDKLIAEAVHSDELGGITLHREQVAALNVLFSGRNLVLSAPTSFGKSLLIDALVASGRYKRLAVVVPTIALLDEMRRRLVGRFGDQFEVLMHHAERPVRNRVIFLGTQERLLNRDDIGNLDLVVVDEFYKLDPRRKDNRSAALNAAVYQLLRKANQFLFIGPNIEDVISYQSSPWRFEFLRTRFSTVAVDTIDLRKVNDKPKRLSEEVYNESNWPALVFVSFPDKANTLADKLASEHDKVGHGQPLSAWMRRNYGKSWALSEAVAAGIAVHHGRMPRALASRFVKYFNDRRLPVLLCTSTLIEGVNTAAKSVLIYDKTIARESYDFFTFSNIKGRAGRLGQHHVGKVFLFNAPPEFEDVEVEAPLFADPEQAPDELIVHLDDDDLSAGIENRLDLMSRELGLTREELRYLASIGLDDLAALRLAIDERQVAPSRLSWSQIPRYDEIRAVCELVGVVKRPSDFGAFSPNQLALYLSKLRSLGTMREFFAWYSDSMSDRPERYDNVFKFLRACEYNLPEYFKAVEVLVNKAGFGADYSLFVGEMARWFRAEPLKVLEEQGVPVQIAERFLRGKDTVESLSRRLRSAAEQNSESLTAFEREWVLDALPR